MESILQGLPRECVYLDDILVTGTSEEEHLDNLKEVFDRPERAGFRLKHHKMRDLITMRLVFWPYNYRQRSQTERTEDQGLKICSNY